MRAAPVTEIHLFSLAGALLCVIVDYAVNGPQSGAMKAARLLAALGAGEIDALAFGAAGLVGAGALSGRLFRPLTRRGAFTLATGLAATIALVLPPISECAVAADFAERVEIGDHDAAAREADRAFLLNGLEMGVHFFA